MSDTAPLLEHIPSANHIYTTDFSVRECVDRMILGSVSRDLSQYSVMNPSFVRQDLFAEMVYQVFGGDGD